MRLINWELIKNPLNWITVVLMLIIFVMFVDTVSDLWKRSAANVANIAVNAS